MKRILAFDTSGPSLSVALLADTKLIFECTQQTGLTHSDRLMPMIDMALQTGGYTAADADCFAVTVGPGSFTGVRIGVATAKALAHATGKPCIGINALEAMAHTAGLFDGLVCAMQDARAGQVYCAAFRNGKRVMDDVAEKLDILLPQLAKMGKCCFTGDGASAHRDTIEAAMGEKGVFAPADRMMIHAGSVALLASERPGRAVSYRELLPYYLRAPQAERERLAREENHD